VQVRDLVKNRYPNVQVIGTNYPVPANKLLLSRLFTMVQLAICALTLFGDGISSMLQTDSPDWLKSMNNNKMSICMVTWFLGNIFAQNLLNTGAFEIAFDGQMIFSKLDEHRMPSVSEMFEAVDTVMRSR
jgi:selT/selW/selH-like putative selenoprotein